MLILPRISGARILASSLALPETASDGSSARFTNDRLVRVLFRDGRRGPRSEEELDFLASSIEQRTGVSCRYWAQVPAIPDGDATEGRPEPSAAAGAPVVTTVDLQERAVREVLATAGARISDVRALVTATSTPAYAMTANSRALVERLGAHCAAIDLRNGCASGIYALNQAFMWASASRGLVVVTAADTLSRVMRGKVMISAAGDAGAALLIGPDDDPEHGIEASVLDSCDEPAAARCYGPFPPTLEDVAADRYALFPSVEHADAYVSSLVRVMARSSRDVLASAKLTLDDIDLVVPHQGGLEVVQGLKQELGGDENRWFGNLARYGNVGAASIFVSLHELRERLPGSRVLLTSVGGGLAWGSTVLRA